MRLELSRVEPRPNTLSNTTKRAAVVSAACSQLLAPEYKISRLHSDSPAKDADSQPPEPPANPPASLRASEVPLPEGEGLGRRRWQTQTAPHMTVVEAGAWTMIEKLLERSQPSSCIPRLRSRRGATLELDADDLDD